MDDRLTAVVQELTVATRRQHNSYVRVVRATSVKLRTAYERHDWDLVQKVREVLDDMLADPRFQIDKAP